MKILNEAQIREWDLYTIKNEPISSIDLMERASMKFCDWFTPKFSIQSSVIVLCGPGNNGGDGLAIARILLSNGYCIKVYSVDSEKKSEDYLLNEKRLLNKAEINIIKDSTDFPDCKEAIVIDALFGSGLSRPLSGVYRELVQYINSNDCTVISIDMPSGMYCDAVSIDDIIINADYTITFQSLKLSLLLPQNALLMGQVKVLDIGLSQGFLQQTATTYFYTEEKYIQSIIHKRDKFSHKGTFGTALIIVGSYGMMGAAMLASKACLRTGVGLNVSYIPKCGYEILQSSLPESMVVTDDNAMYITSIPDIEKYKAIGVGPGIGKHSETKDALKYLLINTKCPLIIDADALNIIAENRELTEMIPVNSILTPHPKEFERLAGPFENDYDRLEKLKQYASKINSVVILKGAYTAIALPDGSVYFNSTGNPGMATGGSGDVLTGIITSLVAQGYKPEHAAVIGVYVHGYAGDKAAEKLSQPSMLASDIIDHIGDFFKTVI